MFLAWRGHRRGASSRDGPQTDERKRFYQNSKNRGKQRANRTRLRRVRDGRCFLIEAGSQGRCVHIRAFVRTALLVGMPAGWWRHQSPSPPPCGALPRTTFLGFSKLMCITEGPVPTPFVLGNHAKLCKHC